MGLSGRHLARRNVVQALYQWSITGQPASQITANFILDERLTGRYLAYFNKLVTAIPEQIKEIDREIEGHISRPMRLVDPIEQSILRVGVYEMLYEIDIPINVVINECVEIAKQFCSEEGYKFVNGVLDNIHTARQTA